MKKYFLLSVIFALFIQLKAQVFKLYTSQDGLVSNNIKCIALDNSGNLWLGTSSNISKYDGTIFTTINSGLAGSNIKALHCDASGIMWVGTQTGLSKYNGTGFTNYSTTNGLPNNNITALTSDANNLWIGTYSSGISKFDGANFTNYNLSSGLVSNNIVTLCFDQSGKLWIGTLAGISVYDGTNFTNYLTSDGLPSNNIKAIVCDVTGNIWIGTANGLCKYNGSSFTNYSTTDGLLSNSISTLGKDNDGNIWIGYTNTFGITKYNGISFTHYQIGNGFEWKSLTCINEWNNNIYAGCNFGLIKFKKSTIPPYRYDYLDTNNIAAAINASGIFFENVNQTGGFYAPKNTTMSSIFASSLWFGGFDQSNLLHLAAQRFLFQQSDIVPGPIFSDLNTYYDDSTWNRIWRISKSEIDYHIANFNQPGYIMPNSIKDWPAPTVDYVDVNNNHIYDPQNGDYPLIRGDLAILTIFNDLNTNHVSGGMPLGIEVHAMAYSFNSTDSALANAVFVNYKFYNYSANDYHDFYVGVYSDIDIGSSSDDYIGCDSLLNMYFGYNGNASDFIYGTNIPAQGVVFLSSPMYAFNYYNNNTDPATSDPQNATEYYNVLNGYWKNGAPYTYGGTGIGGTTPTNYCFSGDPNNPAGWSEVTISSTPGDRRGVGTIGPFSFLAGKVLCVDLAFPNAISYSSKNNLSSVNLLKERTSQLINFYNSQSWDCGQIYVDSTSSPHLYTFNKVVCKN
ncbi:MAG TPA: two-component regulator propeller domain-containing protein, partial [Bacteroidales bacterium]|nr:two-component regulator propeller domain-containing protein [Bacteroidales bacterium]